MWKWSIERKVVAALACAALLPVGVIALFTWLRGLPFGESGAGSTLLLTAGIVAIAVLFAGFLLLRHVYVDVKRHHDVEHRLQSANRFLESLLDNIPAMVFAKEAKDLRILHFNRAGRELLGYSRDELTGKTDHEVFPPEQAQFFMSKDREVLAKGDVVDIPEEEINTRDGIRILHTRKVPVCDARGNPLLLLGISMDITQRKAHEQRILALVDDLKRHSAMLESSNQELESFCYSVSHDLRSPLRAINGYAQLLQQQTGLNWDAEALRCLQRICHASVRMGRLIDDLLEFSRLGRQTLTLTELDMNGMVSRVLDDIFAQRDAPRPKIELHELLPARGDRKMMRRVWQNLLDNAVKYSAGAAQATIAISSSRRDHDIVYAVRDNGVGFDMRYYDKIFGVFERLHASEEFPGTGVGLAIVQRILSRHGGEVWAESEPGSGAAFYFSLPSARAEMDVVT